MEYKELNLGSYNLHLIKTNKFKTINFKLIFRDNIKKEDITIRNLLIDNLTFSTKKYNSRKKMTIKKQQLYDVDVYCSNKRTGLHLQTDFTMSMLHPKYTEEEMLKESIKYFKEIIFNPNVTDEKFDEEIFNVIKENNRIDIITNQENPNFIAVQSLREKLAKNSPISYIMTGYLEDLNVITPHTLYQYYKKFLTTNYIDFYVIGDFDFYEMEHLIKTNFKFTSLNKEKQSIEITLTKLNIYPKTIIKQSSFVQSNLAIAAYFKDLSWYEKRYPATIFNIILGNSPESKFFKDIREKYSCAYSINSVYRRLDDYVLINAGINSKNYKLVIKRIKYCINEVKKGNFDKELEDAKNLYISAVNEINESSSSIIEYYFSLKYLNNDPYEKQIANMQKVTKEEVVAIAKKFKLDIILLLKEKNSNEKNINK